MGKNVIVLRCPNCDAMLSETTRRCEYCGSYIVVDDVSDKKQSENTIEQPQYNPNIIVNINNADEAPTVYSAGKPYRNMKPKNKWIAFILCLFFGYFGIHKFYEGKIGMGILYLFTGGLCGIGWVIDCIVLLAMPTNPYYVH